METITLAKALKIKTRLIGLIKEKEETIKKYNSILAGSTRPVDVAAELETLNEAQMVLVDLKTDITLVNAPIQELIYEASEVRTQFIMWDGINCDEGLVENTRRYTETEPVERETAFTFSDVSKQKKKLQKRLDDIQDALDKHNHSTQVPLHPSIAKWF